MIIHHLEGPTQRPGAQKGKNPLLRLFCRVEVILCLGLGLVAAENPADEAGSKPSPRPASEAPAGRVRAIRTMNVTVRGELLDSRCFLARKGRGTAHRACAEKCARQGFPVMIIDDDTNQVYVLIAAAPTLAPYLAQTATISGEASGGILVPERIQVNGKLILAAERRADAELAAPPVHK